MDKPLHRFALLLATEIEEKRNSRNAASDAAFYPIAIATFVIKKLSLLFNVELTSSSIRSTITVHIYSSYYAILILPHRCFELSLTPLSRLFSREKK